MFWISCALCVDSPRLSMRRSQVACSCMELCTIHILGRQLGCLRTPSAKYKEHAYIWLQKKMYILPIDRMARNLEKNTLLKSVKVFGSRNLKQRSLWTEHSKIPGTPVPLKLKWGTSVSHNYAVCIYITMHDVAWSHSLQI